MVVPGATSTVYACVTGSIGVRVLSLYSSLQELRPYIAYMRDTFPEAAYPLAQADLFVSNNDLFGRFASARRAA